MYMYVYVYLYNLMYIVIFCVCRLICVLSGDMWNFFIRLIIYCFSIEFVWLLRSIEILVFIV